MCEVKNFRSEFISFNIVSWTNADVSLQYRYEGIQAVSLCR